jgi:hypothetical protein
MIKVVVGTNVKRETKIVDSAVTPRQLLEEVGIDYTRGSVNMDGSTLTPGDLDKSFAQHGITSKCYLLQVVKADNA